MNQTVYEIFRNGILTALLIMILSAFSIPAQAQFRVAADIQVGIGDRQLSETRAVMAGPGDRVVIEIFASGIANALGFEAIFQVDDPAAISSAAGSNQGGPFTLPLASTISPAGRINLTISGFAAVNIPAGTLRFIGSLTLTLSQTASAFTVTMISANPGSGPVTQHIALSVGSTKTNSMRAIQSNISTGFNTEFRIGYSLENLVPVRQIDLVLKYDPALVAFKDLIITDIEVPFDVSVNTATPGSVSVSLTAVGQALPSGFRSFITALFQLRDTFFRETTVEVAAGTRMISTDGTPLEIVTGNTVVKPEISRPTGIRAEVVIEPSLHVNVSWTAPALDARFVVQRKEASEEGFAPVATGLARSSYEDRNVQTGKTYVYRVVADLNGVLSSPSEEVSVAVPIFPPKIIGPIPNLQGFVDVPVSIKLTPYESDFSDSGSDLRWTVENVSFAHVSGIRGQRSDDDVITFTPAPGFLGSTTVTLVLTNSSGLTDRQVITLTWARPPAVGSFTETIVLDHLVYGIGYALDLSIQNSGGLNLVLHPLPIGAGALSRPDSLIVAPGRTEIMAMHFVPGMVGAFSDTLKMRTNDPLRQEIRTVIAGTVLAPRASGFGTGYDFGDVMVSEADTLQIPFSNAGNGFLIVSVAVAGANDLIATVHPDTVMPGQEASLKVVYTPVRAGALTAQIRLNTNDPDAREISVPISGRAILAPRMVLSTDRVDLEEIFWGLDATEALRIRNEGTALLRLDSVRVVAVSGESPAVRFQETLPLQIQPNAAGTLTIRMSFPSVGVFEAELVIYTNDPRNAILKMPLIGDVKIKQGIGPLVLDGDLRPGDQGVRTLPRALGPGEELVLDLVATEGAMGIQGFQCVIVFDANKLVFKSFRLQGVLSGLVLPSAAGGKVDVNAASIGARVTVDSGSLGQIAFGVLERLSEMTQIEIASGQFARETGFEQLAIGIDGAVIALGGGSVLAGDFNGDGVVDFHDFLMFAAAFGSTDLRFDLTGDGQVGFGDFLIFASAFGR